MAVRLNVLVLQPSGGGSSWHRRCDDLLGNLLGRPGLDVTLLERLPCPEDGSTETLALEAIGGHVACLAWQEPEQVIADLARAGRPMVRRRHSADPNCDENNAVTEVPSPERPGRMYFFDMRADRDTQRTLADLQTLLATLQTPTFQIGGMPVVKPPSPETARPQTVSRSITTPPASPPRSPVPQASLPQASSTSSSPLLGSQSAALDRLVDQLDELDI